MILEIYKTSDGIEIKYFVAKGKSAFPLFEQVGEITKEKFRYKDYAVKGSSGEDVFYQGEQRRICTLTLKKMIRAD